MDTGDIIEELRARAYDKAAAVYQADQCVGDLCCGNIDGALHSALDSALGGKNLPDVSARLLTAEAELREARIAVGGIQPAYFSTDIPLSVAIDRIGADLSALRRQYTLLERQMEDGGGCE